MVNGRYLVIYLSLVLGLILMILPLPDWVQAYRPNWVALILIYWSMALPKRVGLWFALIYRVTGRYPARHSARTECPGVGDYHVYQFKPLSADSGFIASAAIVLCL